MVGTEINSIVNEFNNLDLENQEYLFDVFHKQIIERKRLSLIQDIETAEKNFNSGNYKKGTVDDFLAELDND